MRASGLSGGVSTPGPGCGVTESLMNTVGTGGLVTATSAVNTSGTSLFGNYNVTGSAQATAGPNTLGTLASITVQGPTDGATARGAEALAMVSESLLPGTGTVVGGTVRFSLGLHGFQSFSPFTTGASSGDGIFGIYYLQPGATTATLIFYGGAGHSGVYTLYNGQYQYSNWDGVTITANSVAVNKSVQFEMPYDSTGGYMSRLILYSGLYAGTNVVLNSDWINTVNINNVEVFDAQGRPVSIVRGTQDTSAVPEPGAGWLAGLGLGALFVVQSITRKSLGHTSHDVVGAGKKR